MEKATLMVILVSKSLKLVSRTNCQQYNKSLIIIISFSSENTKAFVRIRGATEKRNGVDYVTFKQLDAKIQIAKSKFNLHNLFNDASTLNEIGNQFVNENSELFLSELIPGLEKSLSKTFLDIVNVILKDVTFDEMFPDTQV